MSPTNSRDADAAAIGSGVLMLLLTVFVWGAQFPIAKTAFETVDAYHAAVARFSFPATLLLIVLLMREGFAALDHGPRPLRVIVPGIFGMCGAPAFIFGGLMFTQPEIAAIIVATQPLITILAQRLVSKQAPHWGTLFCVLLAFAGVITVVTRWDTQLSLTREELIGNTMVATGAVCWVVYSMSITNFTHWSTLRLTTITMIWGSAANALLVVVLVALGLFAPPTVEQWYTVRYELFFLAFIGVLVPMICWNSGSRRVGTLNAMLFMNLVPVVTFLVRYLQGERFSIIEYIGAAMVIAALTLQNLLMRRQRRLQAV